uniref:Yae1 domain containing 1 n=1 Tax=Jaculus jaculus TaxID=51337 RepID=A0A8C5KW58_JACJA|nr:protein YAE1 homolog [Jaculus jaculus]
MSWVAAAPAVRSPGEPGDVFDEEADEVLLARREWRSHMRRRVQEGYRDGVDAGKAAALQQGFNQGFKEGAGVVLNYGLLRGTLSALLSWCHLHGDNSTLISAIYDLLNALGQCEEYVLTHLKSVTPQPQVGDLLDSFEDMGLCHAVPAEEKVDQAQDERLCGTNADLNKNCGKSTPGTDGPQAHAHLEKPSITWILEQTTNLVKQLGVSADVLQHLRQL